MNKKDRFVLLYQSFAASIFRLCRGFVKNEVLAQDLMQDVFAKAWQHLDSYREEAKASSWIYRIAVNTCLSHFRTTGKNITYELKEEANHIADSQHDAEEPINTLYKCINLLNEADRLIISMVLEKLDYAEIAAAINISEGALRVRIHRIKNQLNKLYEYEQSK